MHCDAISCRMPFTIYGAIRLCVRLGNMIGFFKILDLKLQKQLIRQKIDGKFWSIFSLTLTVFWYKSASFKFFQKLAETGKRYQLWTDFWRKICWTRWAHGLRWASVAISGVARRLDIVPSTSAFIKQAKTLILGFGLVSGWGGGDSEKLEERAFFTAINTFLDQNRTNAKNCHIFSKKNFPKLF